jgi:hypothetical protein
MIRPGRSTRYNAAAGNTGSDTDALQTDVMRFMSILGLCLMAVFALVQSLPLQETDAVRPEPEGEELHKVIAIQQQHAQALAAELERLITQIEEAQASKADAQQALSAAERELKQVVDQTQQARSEQQHLTVELDSLQQQLARVRYALAALQQAADDKAQSLSALEQRLGQEKKRLDEIRQRTHEVKMQQARITPPPAIEQHPPSVLEPVKKDFTLRNDAKVKEARMTSSPVIEKRPPPVPAPVKNGFTLRFASAEALERLVAAGTVNLYAMADKQAWRLSLRHGHPDFTEATFPRWFHEMAASTVPREYVRNLETSISRTARSSIVWGVQLPPTTKRGIASLTRGRQGGNLVIAADGQVTLASE